MGTEAYDEAIEALKKLLIEKEELKTVAAAKGGADHSGSSDRYFIRQESFRPRRNH
jgi:hypothetical protein